MRATILCILLGELKLQTSFALLSCNKEQKAADFKVKMNMLLCKMITSLSYCLRQSLNKPKTYHS